MKDEAMNIITRSYKCNSGGVVAWDDIYIYMRAYHNNMYYFLSHFCAFIFKKKNHINKISIRKFQKNPCYGVNRATSNKWTDIQIPKSLLRY